MPRFNKMATAVGFVTLLAVPAIAVWLDFSVPLALIAWVIVVAFGGELCSHYWRRYKSGTGSR